MLTSFGCTRSESDQAKVKFKLPTTNEVMRKNSVQKVINGKISTQSVEVPGYANLVHAVINVSGPGLSETILCHYDLEHDGESSGPCDFCTVECF